MARLTPAQRQMTFHMLSVGRLTPKKIAQQVKCHRSTVSRTRKALRTSKATALSGKKPGPPLLVTTEMQNALRDLLSWESDRHLVEMADTLLRDFDMSVSLSTLSRTLNSKMRWSKKLTRTRAQEQRADLRDFYMYKIANYASWHLVFLDESGVSMRDGLRTKGWSPRGVAPVKKTKFHRGKRHQVLATYTQDGVLVARVFQGTTDSDVFERFIEQLLPYCGRWPEPRSVLVMDNASIHHSDRIQAMCREAGVILVYLPPYSPDFNPIEEFFAELKTFIRQNWTLYESHLEEGFETFLKGCVKVVGSRRLSARGHFEHAGLRVDPKP